MSNHAVEPVLPKWMDRFEDSSSTIETTSGIRCLVIGAMGAGKTHFALTAPNVLLLNFDHGELTGLKLGAIPRRIQFYPPKSIRDRTNCYNDLVAILDMAVKRDGPFAEGEQFGDVETIVLDGYTQMADVFLKEILIENGKSLTQNGVTVIFDEWRALAARLDNVTELTKKLSHHFIATVSTKLDKDEATGRWIGLPDIVGGYRNDVGRQFDEVWYFDPKQNKDSELGVDYRVHTVRSTYFDSKTRLGLDPIMINPDFNTVLKAYEKFISKAA